MCIRDRADLVGGGDEFLVGGRGGLAAGHHRDAGGPDGLLGVDLVTHQLDRTGRWSDEDEARVGAGAGEAGVLGEEAVAGVDGLGAGAAGGGEDLVGPQVGLGRRAVTAVGRAEPDRDVGLADVRSIGVRVAEHGDRADAEAPQGADHPEGDLAAVGDQNCVEHGRRSSGSRGAVRRRWRWVVGAGPGPDRRRGCHTRKGGVTARERRGGVTCGRRRTARAAPAGRWRRR